MPDDARVSTYCFVANCKAVVGSCVTATEVKPPRVKLEAPNAIAVVPTVTDEFVRLALAMLVSVFAEPEIETPFSVANVPPRETELLPIVTELLDKLPLPMLVSVLLAPLIVLLVSV